MFGLLGASTEILAISLKFHQGSVGVPQTLPWNDVAEMPEACDLCLGCFLVVYYPPGLWPTW